MGIIAPSVVVLPTDFKRNSIATEHILETGTDEAFLVCNIGEVHRKHQEWLAALPRVKPFYAVKCNDNEQIIKVLTGLGVNFDCANKGEFEKVTGIGVQRALFHCHRCGVETITEPRRFYAMAAFSLFTQIHSIREQKRESGGSTEEISLMYFINDGVFGSLRYAESYGLIPQTMRENDTGGIGEVVPCSIWGPTLDGIDRVCSRILLPWMSIGEWLVFHNAGAYTVGVASTFNGFPLPRVAIYVTQSTTSGTPALPIEIGKTRTVIDKKKIPSPIGYVWRVFYCKRLWETTTSLITNTERHYRQLPY